MKKVFFLPTVALLALTALSACGSGGGGGGSNTSAAGTSAPDEELNIGKVVVMCDEKVHEITEAQVQAFMAAHPKYTMTYEIKEGSESNAATNVLADVDAAPDVYFFAQDQLARLVTGGGIAKVPNAYKQQVIDANDTGSIGAAKVGDELYGYPATSDNTFFVYYNKDVLSADDVKSFETIVSKSKAASKKVYFDYGDVWMGSSLFFGAGLKSNWTTNAAGDFTAYDDNFNSEKGRAVVDAMHNLFSDTTTVVSSKANSAFEEGAAVLISGTWSSESVKTSLGDKLGVAVLPSFQAGGQTYALKPFGGFKLVGMKPQQQTDRVKGISQLAIYLTNEACQLKRFEEKGWGPSNKAAQQNDAIKNDAVLQVCFEQMKTAIPQGQFPGGWWAAGNLIGTESVKSTYNAATILQDYADSLDGFLNR